MKKKVISLLMCTIMLLCVLTGCIHQDMGVKMNKNGTGSITTTLGIEKEFYEQLKSIGSDPFEGKAVSEYQYDGSTYVSYAETKEYKSYEEMEQALLAMTYETEIIDEAQDAEASYETDETPFNSAETSADLVETSSDDIFDVVIGEDEETSKDAGGNAPAPTQNNHIFSSVDIEKHSGIFYSSYTFAAVLNPQNGEGLDYDLNETFKVTLTVEMPSEVTGAKGGAVEGNKVVFDIADITTAQELAATCEENNTGLVIGIVIGLVVLAVSAVFLFKHKK